MTVAGRKLRTRIESSWSCTLGVALLLLASTSCDTLIGLRDDYYEAPLVAGSNPGGSSAAGGGSAGLGSFGGTPETGGAGAANGGESMAGSGGDPSDAGAGGIPDGPGCEYPFTPQKTWVPSASSSNGNNPSSAVIDNSAARWSTTKPQAGDEWLQIDFGAPVSLRRINMQQGTMNANDYPRKYAVVVSDVSKNLTGQTCAMGVGTAGVTTTIELPEATTGRYVLIKQLGSSLSWWSVEEIEFSCY